MTVEENSTPTEEIENENVAESQSHVIKSDEELPCFPTSTPGPSRIPSKVFSNKAKKPKRRPFNITKASLRGESDVNSKCAICRMLFKNYRGRGDWIECVQCKKWICGICNSESTDPYYVCPACEDSDDDQDNPFSDNSEDDETFNPETVLQTQRKGKKLKF